MASTCATIAPREHPLLLLRARMQRNDHKYTVLLPPAQPKIRAEVAAKALPPPPLAAVAVPTKPTNPASSSSSVSSPPPSSPPPGVCENRFVPSSPPPTPGRHGRVFAKKRVDVSGYPGFLPASRKRRLPSLPFPPPPVRDPSSSAAAAAAPVKTAKRSASETSGASAPPSSPPAFNIRPNFESRWLVDAHAELGRDLDSSSSSLGSTSTSSLSSDDGPKKKKKKASSSTPLAAPADLAPEIPYVPLLFSGVAPLPPLLPTPEAVRRASSIGSKLEEVSLGSRGRAPSGGAGSGQFRKRTGFYARGA